MAAALVASLVVLPPLFAATEEVEVNEFPAPRPGGLVKGVAGTSDLAALAAGQSFDVESISVLDITAQTYRVFVPGAPDAVNTLQPDSVTPDTPVTLRRRATDLAPLTVGGPTNIDSASAAASTGVASLPVPPPGGLTEGIANTANPVELMLAQPFVVESILVLDVETQLYLTYLPGAPEGANTLSELNLSPESVVIIRRDPIDIATQNVVPSGYAGPIPNPVTVAGPPVATATATETASPESLVVTGDGGGGGAIVPASSGDQGGGASPPPVIVAAPPAPQPTQAPRQATSAPPTSTTAPTPTATAAARTPTPTPTAARTSTPAPTPTAAAAQPYSPAPGTRDPFLWPFASSSPWNFPIGSGAQYASDSNAMSQQLRSRGGSINSSVWSHPVYLASSSDPLRRIIVNGETYATVRIPNNAEPSRPTLAELSSSDSHLHIVQPDHRTLYEMYATKPDGGDFVARRAETIDLLGSGIASSRGATIGTRAYGGSAIGGLLRRWEIEAGEIRHALAFALDTSLLKQGPVWPATVEDRTADSSYSGTIPMGTLLALPANVDINSLGLSGNGRMLARALQDYGGYVVDAARGGVTLYAEPSADSLLGSMRSDFDKLVPLLRPVVNNSQSSVGGGGTPRAPMAPPLSTP
ncbi:MAG: hypothetical protein R3C39_05285 [Dehalococcoidia bacterium]